MSISAFATHLYLEIPKYSPISKIRWCLTHIKAERPPCIFHAYWSMTEEYSLFIFRWTKVVKGCMDGGEKEEGLPHWASRCSAICREVSFMCTKIMNETPLWGVMEHLDAKVVAGDGNVPILEPRFNLFLRVWTRGPSAKRETLSLSFSSNLYTVAVWRLSKLEKPSTETTVPLCVLRNFPSVFPYSLTFSHWPVSHLL